MKKKVTTIHASSLAQTLVQHAGLKLTTQMFNQFRVNNGATERDRSPVKVATVKRYMGQGSGYEVAPPTLFRRFVLSRVAKKW